MVRQKLTDRQKLEIENMKMTQFRKKMEIRTVIGLHRISPDEPCYFVVNIKKLLAEAEALEMDVSSFKKQLPGLEKDEIIARMKNDFELFPFHPVFYDDFVEEYEESKARLDKAEALGVDVSGYRSQLPKLEMLSAMKELENMIQCTETKTVGIASYATAQIRQAMSEAEQIGCKVSRFNKRVKVLEQIEQENLNAGTI